MRTQHIYKNAQQPRVADFSFSRKRLPKKKKKWNLMDKPSLARVLHDHMLLLGVSPPAQPIREI